MPFSIRWSWVFVAGASLALAGCPAPRIDGDPDASLPPPQNATILAQPTVVPALGEAGGETHTLRARIPSPLSAGTASSPEHTLRGGISGVASE